MQILNISVMNRPAKFLTTTPYPLIHVEHIGHTYSLNTIVLRDLLKVSEHSEAMTSTFRLTSPILRDMLHVQDVSQEEIQHQFSLRDIELKSVFRMRTLEPESIQLSSFKVSNIVLNDALATYTAENEAIELSAFRLQNIRRT